MTNRFETALSRTRIWSRSGQS